MADSRSFYEVLTIQSNRGNRQVDLRDGAILFEYYEDIFSPTVTAKLKVINIGNTIGEKRRESLYNGLPLRGGERLFLKVLPNSDNIKRSLNFATEDRYFIVSSITDYISDGIKESFTLHLISKEAISNETARVFKKYRSKISKSVKKIFRDVLGSDQRINIDETSNEYSFIGNLRKPFTVLVWLASRSVPAKKDGNAGFVFYQTRSGFNFRSLDSLTQQKPRAKYTYNKSHQAFDGKGKRKIEDEFRILNYYVDRNQDLLEKLRLGAYSSWRIFYNPLTFSVTIPQAGYYTASQYRKDINTLGGKPKIPKLNPDTKSSLGKIPTRIFSQVFDIGTLNKKVKKDNNADPSEYQSQVLVRYNLLLTQTLNLIVPCNLELKAGDVIECEFPKVTDSDEKGEYDEEVSGLYLIKEICQHFDAENSYSSMKLVRDTFGTQRK
jgi:hypothetical protein